MSAVFAVSVLDPVIDIIELLLSKSAGIYLSFMSPAYAESSGEAAPLPI